METATKKLLVLGGTSSQVSLIKYAIKIGWQVISVGNNPNDVGHQYSHSYYNISTTNKKEILNLAKELKIDVISSFASDPAALTAAFVSEQLGLIGGSIEAVKILSNKALFRNFLLQNGYNTPWFHHASQLKELAQKYNGEKAILKPIDSSGSKGVFIIRNITDLEENFEKSLAYSKSKKVILEKFIERKGAQIHGEAFILNGELKFIYLGDQFFDHKSGVIPYSTIVPTIDHKDIVLDVKSLIQSIVLKCGFKTGGLNIEIIRDTKDNLFTLEIGARNGGNFMPDLISEATGFDLVRANLDYFISEEHNVEKFNKIGLSKYYYTQLILHSNKTGHLKCVNIPKEFTKYIIKKVIYYQKGDIVNGYQNSRDVIGIIIFKINNSSLLKDYFNYLDKNEWIELE